MDTKQPSYQKPTKASLGRVKVFFQPEMKMSKKQIERTRVTKERLDLADRIRQDIPPNEKWPDMSAVRSHRRSSQYQRRASAENLSLSKVPRSSICTKTSSASSKFPIPIRTTSDLTTFPQFSLLPAELRLLIVRKPQSLTLLTLFLVLLHLSSWTFPSLTQRLSSCFNVNLK
jgi:hypothetical protein